MASNLYNQQSANTTRTFLLMFVMFALIIAIGWFISYYQGMPEILLFAFVFSMILNIVSYWYSDKIVLKMAGAKEANKSEYFDLYTIVENLSITAGLPMPKIFVIQDDVPNAFATGRNKEHAVVAFTTGILQLLNKSELEGVAAHELSHIQNKDILLQTVVVVLVGFITLLSDFFLRMSFLGGGSRDSKDGRVGLIITLIGVALMLLSPIIGTIIQLAISRKREFLADASGALLTRYPEGLASGLQKISEYSGRMKKANHATAHLYISDPFGTKEKKLGFLHKLFLTHPPVEERVRALLGK